MPSIQNCTSLPVSIWGRRLQDGSVEGREVYLDDIAAGGSAEFSHHGDLVVRKYSAQQEAARGERLVGPVQWEACTLQQLPSGQLLALDGAHHLCKRKSVPPVVLGLSIALGVLLVVLLVVGAVHLARHRPQRAGRRLGGTQKLSTVAYSDYY